MGPPPGALAPLWELLARMDLPPHLRPAVQLAAVATAVERAFGAADGGALAIDIVVARVPSRVRVPARTFRQVYLPLVVLLAALADRARQPRLLVGVAAPAGAGKSTTCAIAAAIGDAWAAAMAAAFPAHAAPPSFAAVSMDGYHRTNVDLIAHGLLHVKGRRDTIDGAGLARDLARLRAPCGDDDGGDGGSGVIALPEYDRLVTHDVVPGAVAVRPAQRVLLVEGLFMLSAGGGHAVGGEGPEGEAAWAAVASALDVGVVLSVPAPTCRRRTVDRKVDGGVARADAEAHYDRVDWPVWAALNERDACKPAWPGGAAAPLHEAVRRATAAGAAVPATSDASSAGAPVPPRQLAAEGTARGPDLVLHMDDAAGGGGGGGDVALLAVSVRAPPPEAPPAVSAAPRRAAADAAAATSATDATMPAVIVVGMTPCVQRTLVYGVADAASGGLPPAPPAFAACGDFTPSAAGWARGEVNRATVSAATVGGKGPHAALAVVRAAAHGAARAAGAGAPAPPPPVAVDLFDVVGGDSGRQATRFLAGAAAAALSEGGPAPGPAAVLRHCSTQLADAQPTRTCVTVLDHAAADMTEFVEPPSRVSEGDVGALLARVRAAVRARVAAVPLELPPSLSTPRVVLALMGTFPAGAEGVYAALSADAAAAAAVAAVAAGESTSVPRAPAAPPPLLVLMDAHKGVLGALAAGGVGVLKVNADEVRALAAEAASAGATTSPAQADGRALPATLPAPVRGSITLLRRYGGGAAEALPGLRAVVVTQGAGDAFVVEAVQAHRGDNFGGDGHGNRSGGAFALRRVVLPPLRAAACNPIGAGDVVAGVTALALLRGAPLADAVCDGLAAGSASVLTLRGAEWAAADAAEVLAGLRAIDELVLCDCSS